MLYREGPNSRPTYSDSRLNDSNLSLDDSFGITPAMNYRIHQGRPTCLGSPSRISLKDELPPPRGPTYAHRIDSYTTAAGAGRWSWPQCPYTYHTHIHIISMSYHSISVSYPYNIHTISITISLSYPYPYSYHIHTHIHPHMGAQ